MKAYTFQTPLLQVLYIAPQRTQKMRCQDANAENRRWTTDTCMHVHQSGQTNKQQMTKATHTLYILATLLLLPKLRADSFRWSKISSASSPASWRPPTRTHDGASHITGPFQQLHLSPSTTEISDSIRKSYVKSLESADATKAASSPDLSHFAVDIFRKFLQKSDSEGSKPPPSTPIAPPIPVPTAPKLIPSIQEFLNDKMDAVAERRAYYAQHSDPATLVPVVLGPLRILELACTAFVIVEVYFLLADRTQSVYHDIVEPKVDEYSTKLQAWWEKGRRKNGLFRRQTWNHRPGRFSSTNRRVLADAWDEQFSEKHQWMIGTTIGLIVSPVVWAIGGTAGKSFIMAYVLSEINYLASEQVKAWTDDFGNTWEKVGALLEKIRISVRDILRRPKHILLDLRKSARDNIPDDFLLPGCVQQGFLLGVVIGWFIGA